MGIADCWTAGVEGPEGFWTTGGVGFGGDVESLHGDEGAGVAGAEGDAVPAGVELGDGEVEVEGWVWFFGCFVYYHAEGVAVVAAGVGGEDAAVGCNCDADGPLVVVLRVISIVAFANCEYLELD